ncbi:hypothetical protein C8F04DRAFT_1322011 [Mycena alexandri]|uniref:Uncharacterized protein n=1 Tax=Mycena alexandri TaxID=1745969 RepID=A0AAD6S1D4_9AGAR|nr:hypothetical protein C8F04DRAFT_1322011 [Mycena alexandri]
MSRLQPPCTSNTSSCNFEDLSTTTLAMFHWTRRDLYPESTDPFILLHLLKVYPPWNSDSPGRGSTPAFDPRGNSHYGSPHTASNLDMANCPIYPTRSKDGMLRLSVLVSRDARARNNNNAALGMIRRSSDPAELALMLEGRADHQVSATAGARWRATLLARNGRKNSDVPGGVIAIQRGAVCIRDELLECLCGPTSRQRVKDRILPLVIRSFV